MTINIIDESSDLSNKGLTILNFAPNFDKFPTIRVGDILRFHRLKVCFLYLIINY